MSDEALHDGYTEMPYFNRRLIKCFREKDLFSPDRGFFRHVFVFNEFLIDCDGKPRFQFVVSF